MTPRHIVCILDDESDCTGCGRCDYCDLDPDKICDNCCACIDRDTDYSSILIDRIVSGDDGDEEGEDD